MKKYLSAAFIVSIIFASCVKDRITTTGSTPTPPVVTTGDTLILYWNCNADTAHVRTPTISAVTGATFTYGGAYFDTVDPGTTLNGHGVDTLSTPANGALRLRNPASGPFIVSLPTTGYKNVILKYAEERTSKGAQTNTVSYTTDGTNYINTAIASQTYIYNVDTVFSVVSFDFTSDASVNDNANFKVKIDFSNGSANTTGNDRLDNITLYGQKK